MPTGVIGLVEASINWAEQVLFYFNQFAILHVRTGAIPSVIYLLSIGLIVYALIKWQTDQRVPFVILGLVMLLPTGVKYFNPQGMVAIIDVGQGDGLVIKEPFHQGVLLVDTGGKVPFGEQADHVQKSQARFNVLAVLSYLGVSQVDQVFITHGHMDHYGELGAVAAEYKIGEVIFPEGTRSSDGFNQIMDQLERRGGTNQEVLQGKQWRYRSVAIESLYPFVPGTGRNDDSLVLRVTIKDKVFLLTGDLEKSGESALLKAQTPIKADVLGVGHHGSHSSSQLEFLKAVQAQEAIISCGKNNRFGHPHQQTLDHLNQQSIKVFRTDQQGMVYYKWQAGGKKMGSAEYLLKGE